MPGLLDAPVEVRLQELPHAVAVRADDHRAPHRAAVDELGLEDDLVVPGGEVFRLRSNTFPTHEAEVTGPGVPHVDNPRR